MGIENLNDTNNMEQLPPESVDDLNRLKKERDRLKLEKEIENIKKGSRPSSQSSRQLQQFQQQLQELKGKQRSTRGNSSSDDRKLRDLFTTTVEKVIVGEVV